VIFTFVISLGGLLRLVYADRSWRRRHRSILLITILRKQLNWAGFKHSLMATIKTTA
jgi:hypothetical protein